MIRRKHERGFTLIEAAIAAILLAILAALLFGGLNAVKTAHATTCQTSITAIQAQHTQWVSSINNNNPNMNLCAQINTQVNKYNNGECAKTFGSLAVIPCAEFQRP